MLTALEFVCQVTETCDNALPSVYSPEALHYVMGAWGRNFQTAVMDALAGWFERDMPLLPESHRYRLAGAMARTAAQGIGSWERTLRLDHDHDNPTPFAGTPFG